MEAGHDWKHGVWQIGDLLVDSRTRSVSRNGSPIELPPLSFEFLLVLIEAAPASVSIDDLMDGVWKGVVVSPATVAKRAELLRHALGDDSAKPEFVALVRGHGYRLLKVPTAPTQARSRTFLFVGLGLVVLAVVAGSWFWSESQIPRSDDLQKSIAVLPFTDLSEKGDKEWFSSGLAEEILNALVRIPDLQVAARTSSFRFRDSKLSVQQIGEELGVAHVLEGSVRSSPGRVRVTAQLIRAEDGFHLWSENYDRQTDDIIGIQEDMATKIALALQTSMSSEALADMARVGTQSVAAYLEYLKGLESAQGFNTVTGETYRDRYLHFERAREIDPAFFSAHVKAAEFWKSQLSVNLTVSHLTDLSPREIQAKYHERISAATRHSRSETDRLLLIANQAEVDLRLNQALKLYEQYLVQRPNDDTTRFSAIYTAVRANQIARGRSLIEPWLTRALNSYDSAVYFSSSGYLVMQADEAANIITQGLLNWPDDTGLIYQAQRTLLWAQRNAEASEMTERYRALAKDPVSPLLDLREACANGDRHIAEAIVRDVDPKVTNSVNVTWLMSNLLGDQQAVIDILQPLETQGVPFQLGSLLAYKQFDPRPFPSLMAVLEREGIERPPPVTPPFSCPPAGEHQ